MICSRSLLLVTVLVPCPFPSVRASFHCPSRKAIALTCGVGVPHHSYMFIINWPRTIPARVIHLVAEDQTCGVLGRYIGENVAFLRDVVSSASTFILGPGEGL